VSAAHRQNEDQMEPSSDQRRRPPRPAGSVPRRQSLATKILVVLLLTTAASFAAFGFYVRGEMRDRFEQQVVRVLLSDQAQLAAERLDALTEQVYRNGSLIEGAARRLLRGGDVALFEQELDLMLGLHQDFQHVLVADAAGDVRVAVDTLSLDVTRRSARRALEPRSVRGEDWFQATIDEDLGLFWVDRHLSPLLHHNPDRPSRDPNDYSLGLAFQVQGEGEERGVAYALIHWRRVQDIVDAVAARLRDEAGFESATVSVADGRGVILASSDRALYSARLAPQELAIAVLTGFEGAQVVAFDSDGEGYLAGTSRVGGDASREFDWRCVVSVPDRELFATTREFSRLLIFVTALVCAVLAVWSWLATRAFLRPVGELAAATTRVAAGDLDVRVPDRGGDELAELGRAFNAMTTTLADTQLRLRDAAREAAWAEMARQVAHEIKNPLTPMRMSAQMVQRARALDDPRLPELVERLARTVVEQTDQLARIASDFRHFAGRPDPTFVELAASDLLQDVAGLLAAERDGGRLLIEEIGDVPSLSGDRGELRRVLLNLVQNGLQAAAERGHVVLRARHDAGRGEVVFSVEDDGSGVDAETAARLFEPYFTTRSSGTGLGLAISKRIVEAHLGRIWLDCGEPGKTRFCVALPAAG
jgi:signal transduction histidine kinase